MTDKKMMLKCHCGFSAETPRAFLDHALATKHVEFAGVEESGFLAELEEMIGTILAHSADPTTELPAGAEIRQLTEEDILDDEDLTDEQKREILGRFAAAQALAKDEQADDE
jgi:hypothetical protein